MAKAKRTIGILALQGDVSLHARALDQLGAGCIHVKKPDQLLEIDGLIIPGGESTTLLKLMEPVGMLTAIKDFAAAGKSIFGTCAGAIILATKVTHPVQQSLGLIDITVRRNGYGRQIDSFEAEGRAHPPLGSASSLPMTFIRAPRITAVGPDVKVLATYHDEPVLVRQNSTLAATFHPELTGDLRIYQYWLRLV